MIIRVLVHALIDITCLFVGFMGGALWWEEYGKDNNHERSDS